MRRALVSAARGIGDILRVTPLVRVCARLGYDVDMLVVSDYPDLVSLVEGDPDVRRVFHVASPWRGAVVTERVAGLAGVKSRNHIANTAVQRTCL